MPRKARQKFYDAIYHIMCRSISEVDLFKDDEDKKNYISLVKKYQKVYEFRVYGYCLMDNHVHMIIDSNGADISNIMHSINFSYAQYFNRIHKRHGHLFQERFKSKVIKNDINLIAASAYVHKNPLDIKGYEKCPEMYEFSSLAIYLGLRHDPFELIEKGFVMRLFGQNPKAARKNYIDLIYLSNDKKLINEIEFIDEETEYRSGRKILVRNFKTEDIIEFIVSKMDITKVMLHLKNCKGIIEAKALFVLLARNLCNYKCSQICAILGNITQARVSNLSSLGVKLITNDKRYESMVREFIECYS